MGLSSCARFAGISFWRCSKSRSRATTIRLVWHNRRDLRCPTLASSRWLRSATRCCILSRQQRGSVVRHADCRLSFAPRQRLHTLLPPPAGAGPRTFIRIPRLAPWGYHLAPASRASPLAVLKEQIEGYYDSSGPAFIRIPRLAPWGYHLAPASRASPFGGAQRADRGLLRFVWSGITVEINDALH